MSGRWLLATVVVAALARIAAADNTSQAAAQYAAGQSAYDDKNYDDALVAWNRSYTLSGEPALLFNIAQAYRLRAHHGDCALARDAYEKFIAVVPTSPQRATADGLLAEVKQCADAEVVADTYARTPVTPIEPPYRAPPPAERGHGKQVAGVVVGGAGAVSLVVGLVLGSHAASLGDQVTTTCKTGCSWDAVSAQDQTGRHYADAGWVVDGVGAAALIAGGILYWVGTSERASVPAIVVAPGGGGAVMSWTHAW